MKLSLLEKHKPTSISEVVGNATVIKGLREQLLKKSIKPILISGPVGVGKTLVIELLSKELNFEDVWYDATELDSAAIERIDAKSQNILNLVSKKQYSKKLIIIDNADGFPESINKTLINKIKNCIHNIVIICNDAYPLKTIENYCEHFKFIRPSKIQIKKYLFEKKIFKESEDPEKNKKIHHKIEELITETNNDIRFLLNSLGMKMTYSEKDQTIKNVFDAATILFNPDESYERKIDAFDFDSFLLPMMVHENYINVKYSQLDSILDSINALVDSDLFSCIPYDYKASSVIKATIKQRSGFPSFPKIQCKSKIIPKGIDRLDTAPFLIVLLSNFINSKKFTEANSLLTNYSITKEQMYENLFILWLSAKEEIEISTKNKTAFTKFINKLSA